MSTQQQEAPVPTAEHKGVEAVVDEVKERFTREWDSLKARARTAFEKLSEEDVESVKGRFDELRARVVKAYGYAEERAHEEVARLLHRSDAKPSEEKRSRKKQRGLKRRANAATRSASR